MVIFLYISDLFIFFYKSTLMENQLLLRRFPLPAHARPDLLSILVPVPAGHQKPLPAGMVY